MTTESKDVRGEGEIFSNVAVFGLATHSNLAAENWKHSAEQMGVQTTYVAMGKKWEGFRWGLQQLYDVLSATELPDDTLIVVTDVYDVLVQATPSQIIEKYRAAVDNYRPQEGSTGKGESLAQSPLLVSLEATCMLNCAPFHPQIETQKRRYINSGVWAGPKDAVMHMLDWCIAKGGEDDQVALGKYTKLHVGSVAADLQSQFSLVPHAVRQKYSSVTISPSGIVCEKNICPAFLHFPGLNMTLKPWRMRLYNDVAQARNLPQIDFDNTASINKLRCYWTNVFPFVFVGLATLVIVAAIVALVVSMGKQTKEKENRAKSTFSSSPFAAQSRPSPMS